MSSLRSGALFLLFGLAACADEGRRGRIDNDPPLSELPPLLEGWPGNDKLPDEGKADELYPVRFDGPMQWQSPVKSQGSRGVCSIFSALGLMEHLYLKEGTLTDPDFSEQFLQWSVKSELKQFTDTEGSNSNYNLQAINRYGVVEEADWRYETSPWGASNDPACTGEDRPVRCWTNGEPPATALDAQRFHLPPGRWISSRRDSLKSHMVRTNEAVVIGGAFYYQSWNHRSSELPVDTDLFRKGIVTYPNDEDKEQAERKPAGHSFVLVGWDDEMEVQVRDGEGKKVVDADGNPLMEKGFFLFRNSWGTTSFGVENEYGPGYGWISMDYVEEYLTAYVSGLPELDLDEVCGDERDNDFDGRVDCDDADCGGDGACGGGSTALHTWDGPVAIPDNDPAGVVAGLDVDRDGTIQRLEVTVDIQHTYRGDLKVVLVRDGQQIVLHDQKGGSEDNLQQVFAVTDFAGLDASGRYELRVSDHASQDTGTLKSFSVAITTGGPSNVDVFTSGERVAIPDNDPTGAFSNLEVTGPGVVQGLKAIVDIDHDYKGDLTLKLQRVGVPGEATLVEADASSGPFGTQSFVVSDFVGDEAAGTWRLVVIDEARGDAGTLQGWSLEVAR